MAFIKLIAFGDIHGCRRVAETAIQIANDKSVKAVFLGDYVDRGSNSMGVLKVLMEAKEVNPKWVFLRGNHDQMLLDVINGIRYEPYDEETYNKTLLEFNAMDNDFKTKALEFLESTQLYYETNDFIFVHAPLQDDGKILSNKSIEELTWNYSFDPEWKGKPFIHGHYNTQHVDFSTNSININTACGYDGKLTGLLIDEENKTEFEVFYIGEDGTILNEFRVVNSGIHSFRQFSGKTFFYPACGRDILEPIKQCLEIDTFVFNDIHDFSIDIMNELMGAFK